MENIALGVIAVVIIGGLFFAGLILWFVMSAEPRVVPTVIAFFGGLWLLGALVKAVARSSKKDEDDESGYHADSM